MVPEQMAESNCTSKLLQEVIQKIPQAKHHQSHRTTKLLHLGVPGSGKTGALACLAKAGYRLIVADFDNGLDILVNLLRNNEEALDRLYYETFTDKLQMIKGMTRAADDKTRATSMIVPKGTPNAFTDAMNGLTRWKFPVEPGSSETYDLGNIGDWGPDTVFVLDSLGLAAEAALRLVRQLNMHQMDSFTSQPDYGQAMQMVEGVLQLLHCDAVNCHVIVNTHITFIEDIMKGTLQGLPRALGSKLPPKVGGYFNTIIGSQTEGIGKGAKHVIHTATEARLELKLPIKPGTLPATLPVETGLLTLFKALQSSDWKEEKVGEDE